jgi:glycosyltransferase involved in cell wall biosynthesis
MSAESRHDETIEFRWDSPAGVEPRASIVLTTWQCEPFVAAAVQSALSQTVPFELVVRDDGSTDASVDVALTEVNRSLPGSLASRVLVMRGRENRGLGFNFTRAVEQCRCEWIFNFDGDDISSPDRIALSLAKIAASPDASALFAGCIHSETIESLPSFEDLRGGHLGGGVPIAPGLGATMAVRRDLMMRFGPLPDRIVSHDHLLAARAIIISRIARLDTIVVKRRWHATNITRRVWGAAEHRRSIDSHRDLLLRIEDFANSLDICVRSGVALGPEVPPVAQALVLATINEWSRGLGYPGDIGVRSMLRLMPRVASKSALVREILVAPLRPLRKWLIP